MFNNVLIIFFPITLSCPFSLLLISAFGDLVSLRRFAYRTNGKKLVYRSMETLPPQQPLAVSSSSGKARATCAPSPHYCLLLINPEGGMEPPESSPT